MVEKIDTLMKTFVTTGSIGILSLIVLNGCGKKGNFRPIDPGNSGLTSSSEKTPPEAINVHQLSIDAFTALLGAPLPDSFGIYAQGTVWFSGEGKLHQLRVEGNLSREDFQERVDLKNWEETGIPDEYLQGMHLPKNVPKEIVSCYVGRIEGKPAFLFWSDSEESILIVRDY